MLLCYIFSEFMSNQNTSSLNHLEICINQSISVRLHNRSSLLRLCFHRKNWIQFEMSQPAFTCSNLTIETLEQGINFEHVIAGWGIVFHSCYYTCDKKVLKDYFESYFLNFCLVTRPLNHFAKYHYWMFYCKSLFSPSFYISNL